MYMYTYIYIYIYIYHTYEGSLLELDLAENKVGDQGALELLRAARFAPPGAKVNYILKYCITIT